MDPDFNPWADDANPSQKAADYAQPQYTTNSLTREYPIQSHLRENGFHDLEIGELTNDHSSGSADDQLTSAKPANSASTVLVQPTAAFDPWGGFDDFAAFEGAGKTGVRGDEGLKLQSVGSGGRPAGDEKWEGDEDEFGVFEGFEGFQGDVTSDLTSTAQLTAGPPTIASQPKTDESVFFPRPQPLWSAVSSDRKARGPKRSSPRPPRDENVLFDAEDVSDEEDDEDGGDRGAGFAEQEPEDDDFGEFETAEETEPVEDRREAVMSFGAGGSLPVRAASSTSPRPSRSPMQRKSGSMPPNGSLPVTSPQVSLSTGQQSQPVHRAIEHETRHDQSLLDLDVEAETTAMDTIAVSSQYRHELPDPGPASNSGEAERFDPFANLDTAFGSTMHANGRSPISKNSEASGATQHANGYPRLPYQNKTSPPFVPKPLIQRAEREAHPPMPETGQIPEADEEADGWGDWEEPAASNGAPATRSIINGTAASLPLPELLKSRHHQPSTPPSNVPPPAVLLSLFPPIFQTAQSTLLNPLTLPDSHQRETLATHPSTHQYLRDYLTIATVLAHIIAGRKQRWKRDTRLAQSMSISQAGTRASGMKLTSLDKSESTREEREVANVVRAWRLQVGKLRTAISAAGLSVPVAGGGAGGVTVPEISEMVPVRTALQSEGALTAIKPCALCALKRNERVQKVDVGVEDSFGEWWVEYWGHRSCCDFWNMYEEGLRSR